MARYLNLVKIMERKEKSINKVLVWQIGTQFLLQGLSFFTVPIFTRLLTPADYGQMSTYNSWVSLLGLFVGLQTHGTIALAKIKFGDDEFYKYLSSIMTLSLLSFLFIFPFSFIFKNTLGILFGFPAFLIPVIVIHSFFSYCITFYSTVLVQLKKVEKNAILSLIRALSMLGLSFLFVLNMNKNRYLGRIFADVLVVFFLGLFLIILIYHKGKVFYSKKHWNFCLPLCIPLIFHGVGGVIFSQSDRVMLKAMVGESEAGIYSVVYTLALVINIIRDSCNSIWEPFYYEDRKKGNFDIIKIRSKNYLIFFTIITMGFILLSPEVFKLLAPESYWSGIKIIPLVAMAYYFNFMYKFPANYEFYHGKNGAVAMCSAVVAVINIVLNYFLIPKYNGSGAAIATLVSFILAFAIHDFNVRVILKANDYEYTYAFYLIGIIPIFMVSVLYYVLANYWYLRWCMGGGLAIYLLASIIKRKGIF